MFYVQEIVGDVYSVVDTSDGSVDKCSLSEIREFFKMGIHIEGVKKPLGDLNRMFRLQIDLNGHLLGIDKFGEVKGFFGNGLFSYRGRVRYQASVLRLLSQHQITETSHVICIEEVKAISGSKDRYLKSHIYYVDIAKQTIKLIDSMQEFCAGKHVIAKENSSGIVYGRKVISKQSLLKLVV